MSENEKSIFVNALVLSSVAVFALNRHISNSMRFPFHWQHRWQNFVSGHLSFYTPKRVHTSLTYALSHRNWGHLGMNMVMCWVLGKELARADKVSTADLTAITSSSAVATALAEVPVLSPARTLIGASGIAMGYLGALTVTDPNKSWVMVLPIPGLPVTTLQLGQASILGHLGILAWKGVRTQSQLALRGHVAGFLAGHLYAQCLVPHGETNVIQSSKEQWKRSVITAGLAMYFAYVSVRLALSKPFIDRESIEKLKTQKDSAWQQLRDKL